MGRQSALPFANNRRPVDPIVEWPEQSVRCRRYGTVVPPADRPVAFDARPDWLVSQPPGSDEFRAGWIAHAEGRRSSDNPYCAARDADRYVAWDAGWGERETVGDITSLDTYRERKIAALSLRNQNTQRVLQQDAAQMEEIRKKARDLRAQAQDLEHQATTLRHEADKSMQPASALLRKADQLHCDIKSGEREIAELKDEMGTPGPAAIAIDEELGL